GGAAVLRAQVIARRRVSVHADVPATGGKCRRGTAVDRDGFVAAIQPGAEVIAAGCRLRGFLDVDVRVAASVGCQIDDHLRAARRNVDVVVVPAAGGDGSADLNIV